MTTILYNIFGPPEEFSIFKTQETKINTKFIYYYENSISSIAYLFTAIYLLYNFKKNNKFNIENTIIIINLFLISFISFLWWASQRKYIHQIDIVLYSNLIILIGLYTLLKKHIISQLEFITIFTIFLCFIIFLVKTNNHKLIKPINIISGIVSGYSLIMFTKNYMILFIFILSILFKLNDTFNNNLNISYYVLISGTAWFHILSAFGYGMLLIQI